MVNQGPPNLAYGGYTGGLRFYDEKFCLFYEEEVYRRDPEGTELALRVYILEFLCENSASPFLCGRIS